MSCEILGEHRNLYLDRVKPWSFFTKILTKKSKMISCDLTMSQPWNQVWKPWFPVAFPLNTTLNMKFPGVPKLILQNQKKNAGFKKVMFSHDFHVFIFFDRRRCWACCSQPPVSRCWLWRLHGVAGGGGWGTEIPILHQHKLRINRQKFWLNKQTWWFDRHIVLFEHFWTCLNHVKARFNMGFSSTIKIYTSLIFLTRNPWHGIV